MPVVDNRDDFRGHCGLPGEIDTGYLLASSVEGQELLSSVFTASGAAQRWAPPAHCCAASALPTTNPFTTT